MRFLTARGSPSAYDEDGRYNGDKCNPVLRIKEGFKIINHKFGVEVLKNFEIAVGSARHR